MAIRRLPGPKKCPRCGGEEPDPKAHDGCEHPGAKCHWVECRACGATYSPEAGTWFLEATASAAPKWGKGAAQGWQAGAT